MKLLVNNKVIYAKETSWQEFAWQIKDALAVLEYVASKENVVLGGDILDNNLNYTYDNWFYNTDESKSLCDNSVSSVNTAKEYISNYIKRNGTDYYVVIVLADNIWCDY